MWNVEYTDEFEAWWNTLNDDEQDSVRFTVKLLEDQGPSLKFPYSSDVKQSRHSSMRELRSQCKGIHCVHFTLLIPDEMQFCLLAVIRLVTIIFMMRWFQKQIKFMMNT